MKRGKKGVNDFKFATFAAYFQREGAASMAVKRLTIERQERELAAWRNQQWQRRDTEVASPA